MSALHILAEIVLTIFVGWIAWSSTVYISERRKARREREE